MKTLKAPSCARLRVSRPALKEKEVRTASENLRNTSIVFVLLLFTTLPLQAQNAPLKTMEELGWQMQNFAIPQLTDIDTGYVDYLVTINRSGKITHLKILKSGFSKETEKLWRKSVMKSSFMRTDWSEPVTFEGRITIASNYCSDDDSASEDQLQILRNKPRTP